MNIVGRIPLTGMASACPVGMLANVAVDGTHYVLAKGDAGGDPVQIAHCEGLDDQNITISHADYDIDIFNELGLSDGGSPTQGIQIDTVYNAPGTPYILVLNDRERVGAAGNEVLGILYSISSPGTYTVAGHYRYLQDIENIDGGGYGGALGCTVVGSNLCLIDGFGNGFFGLRVKLLILPLSTEVDLTAGSWDAKSYRLPIGDMTSTTWWIFSDRDPRNMATVYEADTNLYGVLAYKTTHEGEAASKLWRTIINVSAATIGAFSNNGSGGTTVTIASGDDPVSEVVISGTTNYNGPFTVSNVVPGVSFDINMAFVANDATGAYYSNDGKNNISSTFGVPFDDEGKDFAGNASIHGDDWYTNPSINVIDASTLEVIFIRGYSDNDGWIGVRRFLCDRDLNVIRSFGLQTFQLTTEVGVTFEAGHAYREGGDIAFMIRENDALTFKTFAIPGTSGGYTRIIGLG